MARTLSRIARNVNWIAAVLSGLLAADRAWAEPSMQVSRPPNVIQNPFAAGAQSAGQPAIPVDDGSPRAYRNPFAPRPDVPRTLAPQRQRGPLSRWRSPAVAAPARDAAPPEPVRFAPDNLDQPYWLTPNGANAANSARDPVGAVRLPQPTPSDPFDAPAETPMALEQQAESCYAEAERAAAAADSLEELAGVVQLCQQGLASRPQGDLARALRGLAAWAANRRGELKSDDGREDDALREFEAAIQFDPQCWLAIHNRAVSRAQQGNIGAALEDFNRSLALNPGLAVAYRNRGELLASLGRTEEAVADYDRAIEQVPEDAGLRLMRGHALHRLGQYQNALDDLSRAIRLAPQSADAYAHRGNVFAELGDFGRAVSDYQQSLALDAESADAYRSLAWLLATCPDPQFRHPQKALTAAERAARLAPPGDPFVLDALAAAYASAGRFDQAVRYQREAISAAPDGFAEPFSARLALYEQRQPFRNASTGTAADANIDAASLERPARQQ